MKTIPVMEATENKAASQAKTMEQQDIILDTIPAGIMVFRFEEDGTHIVSVNRSILELMGFDKQKALGEASKNITALTHPDDLQLVLDTAKKLSVPGTYVEYEYRHFFRTKNDYIWVLGQGRSIRGDDGYVYAYVNYTDITARKEVETLQNRQKELFDIIPSGILEFFYDGKYAKVISANQTLIDMIGYTDEDFARITYWELTTVVHPEDYYLLAEARSSIETGKGKTYDFRLFNKKTGVYRWISCDYTITERSERGIKVISAFLDIDDKRRLEDASAAKSAFLSRMSHEIRTPINAILGMAELGRQDVKDGNIQLPVIMNYFDETIAASQYLLALVNDVLDSSRIENNKIELHPTIVNAQDFLQNISSLVEPLAKSKGIKLIFEQKLPYNENFIGDAVRLKQILINILNNAIKFTPKGGEIYFSSEAAEITEQTTILRFVVKDTGIGMTEEFQKNLFSPFTQENTGTTSPFEGTGLGLSIAKALAVQMGGDIICQSEKGMGTTFFITIKVENVIGKPKAEEKIVDTGVENMDFSNVRILLCEDHPLNQKIAKTLLERRRCMVDTANDGLEGLRMFKESPQNYYSLILMDIRMPLMDGLETTKEIRSLKRADAAAIPIVAMSANAYEEDVRKSLTVGMNAHLAKPVDPGRLYKTIAALTGQPGKIIS